ncbi:hypothetical protein R1sor_019430 [Riccia sorocarpa]|uniref:Reverse transcriptase domain-containing protein n=1 Tax=Riccia sorocarpa TaxID=122646 RepID=A0ABD3ICI0_9MARC
MSTTAVLAEVPGAKEITELVDSLPKEKAPGVDGLTAEVLKESLEWTEEKCILFLQEVWSHHNLPANNKTATVKLLPKCTEKHLIKNWRPISLLSLSYKLIGRILAMRLKKILPRIVDIDQTGFVEGRSIMDNVLSLKLCQDLTNITGEPALFCKLDFEKAFDRPLMRLLRDSETHGGIKGVSIPKGRPIMHKLFADDSGICIAATEVNFMALKGIKTRFENISGAKLNLGKSIILPILDRSTPWLNETGCRVLNRWEEVKYLGCKDGFDVRSENLQTDLVERLSHKLSHWTHRFLSWPSRVTLTRHVLRALPVYQLLGLGLPEAGFKRLEALCRTFIWGTNGTGQGKTTLIAWQ